jgi:hemerythrin
VTTAPGGPLPLVDLARIPQVALAFINQDHREEARLLNELARAIEAQRAGGPREAVLEGLDRLFAHTREHFGREEAAMQRSGFPPYPVHKEEHDRVLEELAGEGQAFREKGDLERLWRYVSVEMPAWFLGHIQSMDHVTAQYVAMREG